MANLIFPHSSAPLKTVEEIQFGILSPEEIKNMSVVHIIYPETMDETRTKPRDGGLNDPLLGSLDRNFQCKTCGQLVGDCPGHFGHIELARAVFHPGFLKKIKKILEMVCHNCSKLLCDRSDPEFLIAVNTRDPKVRFARVWKVCKGKKTCEMDTQNESDPEYRSGAKPLRPSHGGCGNAQPQVRHSALTLTAQVVVTTEDGTKQKNAEVITPEKALQILRRISDEDMIDMGLNVDYARPEWMIITVLPVPPPPVRPSISMDGTGNGIRNEDDLTYKLGDIIRANSNVKQSIREGSPQHILRDFEELLQYHVATYMDNDIAGQPRALQKSGRPVKAIRARLKGKEGRLRGNLMGKRVDFSARTVITGDANLSLDEVGVPRSIARTLTYPETVTPYNISRLHELVQNGPTEHPGAKYIVRTDGSRVDLRHHKRSAQITLEYGWKVERHLQDGDFIIFNRQPSLHKESMMGHRVRVMPYSTFRLNLSVTSPYNADFDGDEMNLHVPQSEETRAEIMQLCMVPLNIVSPQKNGPLMGIVQDSLAGVYKLTRRDTFLTKQQVMNCLLWVPGWDGVIPIPAIHKPKPLWTGKQLISLVIPKIVSLLTPAKDGDLPLKDEGLLIQNGELMYGLLTKKNVGAASGGIVHVCYNELGPAGAMAFLNGVQQTVNYWLLHVGHSMGIGDTVPDRETIAKVQDHIDSHKLKVAEITALAERNEMEALPGMNIRESFESKVLAELNGVRNEAGVTTQGALKDCNNAVTMASSGSKGSEINISQMSALVGQQNVEGSRIPFGFKYRTLPHFTKDDYSPEARGFVENSYLRGLTPTEFFFHAMAGREGLIDTAVKTAETGYIQRRLVKALEDVAAKYDGTVRNSMGDVIQFLYGEDGLDAMCIEKQKLDHVLISDREFDAKFRLDVMSQKRVPALETLEHGSEMAGDPSVQQLLDEEYETLQEDRRTAREILFKLNRNPDDSMQLPLNIGRLIEISKRLFNVDVNRRSELRPQDVIPAVKNLLERLTIVRGDDPLSIEADRNATMLFKILMRSRLSFKRLACFQRLNRMAFEHVLGELENRWSRAFISPGEMIGVLAAQSIGEPATQMTLNTFHSTGIANKLTQGVPRLKEILNLASNLKTPALQVHLDTEFKTKEDAKKLRSRIEHSTLGSVTAVTEIYYDPEITTTVVEEDVDTVESHFLIGDADTNEHPPDTLSRWLLRIVLDRAKMLDRNLTIEDVAAKIREEYKADMSIIYSDENADEQVIRIRTVRQADDKDEEGQMKIEDDVMLKRLETHLLNNLSLRGVDGIDKAFINKLTPSYVNEAGAVVAARKGDSDVGTEYFLDTSGSAFLQVLTIPGVDATRTYSNDLWQIIEVLGVEAARAALCRELTLVLAFDSSYVNHRHIAILVDVMTYRGVISAVTRHGINRADTGALMRCSFEETVEILLEAAATGELDDCRGISENVMLGQMAPMGTGAFDVQLDPRMLETVISDNSRMGLMPGMPLKDDGSMDGAATPYDSHSPMADSGYLSMGSPGAGNFSPIQGAGSETPAGFPSTEYGGAGWGSGGMSPYNPTSPFHTSPRSPFYSPSSPNGGYSPTSPYVDGRFAASPQFSPSSPSFSPTSPMMRTTSPASPNYSPTSPSYSPASPSSSPRHYSPTSPAQFNSPTSPSYSPASPNYSPTSPNFHAGPTSPSYSPASPAWSPTSPAAYSPTSPTFQRSPAGHQSPTSPSYSPTSPTWSPRTPGPGGSNSGGGR